MASEKKSSKSSQKAISTLKSRVVTPTTTILELCRQHQKMCVAVEYKEPIPVYQGKDAPTALRALSSRECSYIASPSSTLQAGVLMDMFKKHEYSFTLATILNMSSSGTGAVNSVIAVGTTLSALTEFTALAGVFNEFFVKSMHVAWQPVGRYNGPLGFVPATNVSSLPIGLANLQHGATAYTNLGNMSENYRFAYANTSDPFSYDWINPEDPKSTVVVTQSAISQAWMQVGNASSYGGTVQLLSQSAPPALPVTAVLGTFAVTYKVLFRIRE